MPAAAALRFDLVVIADPRLRYADGRCLAALLAAAARRGWRTGLLPVLGRSTGQRPFHRAVALLLARGTIELLDGERPHEAALVLVHHLLPVRQPPQRPLALQAGQVLLRIDQPWRARDGSALVPLRAALEHTAELCGLAPEIVAADARLREELALERVTAAELWPPVTLVEPVVAAEAPGRLRLGRHVAGGEGAWPADPAWLAVASGREGAALVLAEAAARAWPAGAALPADMSLDATELVEPGAFLGGLDLYLLATDDAWRPHLLPGLAEALAAGTPLLGPPALAPLLGPAAAYAPAAEAPAALLALTAERRAELREAARAFHAAATAPEAMVRRLEARLGSPRPQRARLSLRRDLRARSRLLLLSPNGIGMGHLTRLLAVARRCPPEVEPVFLSMSQAVGVVEGMGYVGEHFPFYTATGEMAEVWGAALRARLNEAIAFYDPRCVVFDGNVPYQGLIDCRKAHPDRPFVWIRRGLWRRDAGRATIDRGRHFDLIVEPGELAAALDPGPTAGRRGETVQVPPVVLLDSSELLGREAARAALGLDPERTAVLVQLGSRNNFDYAAIDQVVLEELGTRPEVELVFVDWMIGEAPSGSLPPHVRRLSTFPVCRYLRAFDLAVSAAGYNSFHELLRFGVPTIFVPNENPMMDAQELRALWAERQGLALLVRRHDPYRMVWAVRRLLDPERRRELAGRCAAMLPPFDGAQAIARLLLEQAAAVRLTDGSDRLPHSLMRTP